MKTKLLSKLMLVAFTMVMIVGCGSKLMAQGQPNNCMVCADKDTYKITPDSVLFLIRNFHNEFINKGIFSNAGGYISFNPAAIKSTEKALSSYYTLKFHWGYEEIDTYKRLFVTMEQKNPLSKCEGGLYKGTYGIESANLFTSWKENDVQPFGLVPGLISTVEVLKGLLDPQINTKDIENIISQAQAVTYHSAFDTPFHGEYECKDIVFNNTKTGAVIQAASDKNGFIYFFGYDPRHAIHKIRLILAGLDKDNKIVFFSADDFMFRENSRPRP